MTGRVRERGILGLAGLPQRQGLRSDTVIDGAPMANGEYGFTMMGEGDIDFPWIMEQLDAVGYEGDYALEYEVEEVPPEEGMYQFYDAFAKMLA